MLLNFSNNAIDDYRIGFPTDGEWQIRLNSDSTRYSEDFADTPVDPVHAESAPYDGYPASGTIAIGPYSIVIMSQESA